MSNSYDAYSQWAQGAGFPATAPDSSPAGGVAGYLSEYFPQGSASLPRGFKLAGSVADFMTLLSDAEQFAAATGGRHAIGLDSLNQLLKDGWATRDPYQVWGWMAGATGVAQTMPWAQFGMTQQQYTTQQGSLADTWEQYTGNRDVPTNVLQQAFSGRWTSQHLQAFMQKDPSVQQNYGWVRFGMTYDAFQQYKLSNKQDAVQRFGSTNLNDVNYVAMLTDPLQAFTARPASFSEQQSGGQAGAATTTAPGRQSAVR